MRRHLPACPAERVLCGSLSVTAGHAGRPWATCAYPFPCSPHWLRPLPFRRVPSRCRLNIPFSVPVNSSALIICSFYVFYATHGIFLSRDLKVFVPDFAFRPGSLHGSPWWLRWQRITCQSRIGGLDPWVRKIPWRRKWQPATVFLPGEPHGCRSLVGYSPRGHKEWDPTERVNRQLAARGYLGDSEPSGLGTDSSRGRASNYPAQHLTRKPC